ncbi:MAG: hypothetical protein GY749_28125 [Desulfobacteraceae bacterium]|nr:hypothetical protein [Desulfobacteraceae bacterium]
MEVTDTGDGRSESYVYTSDLARLTRLYQVEDISELNSLTGIYAVSQGDVAEVADTGTGEPATYVYAYQSEYGLEQWVRFDRDGTAATADSLSRLAEFNGIWIGLIIKKNCLISQAI